MQRWAVTCDTGITVYYISEITTKVCNFVSRAGVRSITAWRLFDGLYVQRYTDVLHTS